MDIVVNNYLKLVLEESDDNCLCLNLNSQQSVLDLNYLIDQITYQAKQFEFDKFLIEVTDPNEHHLKVIETIMSTANHSNCKIGFVFQLVDEINYLYQFRDILKKYLLSLTRIFISTDRALRWINASNSFNYDVITN